MVCDQVNQSVFVCRSVSQSVFVCRSVNQCLCVGQSFVCPLYRSFARPFWALFWAHSFWTVPQFRSVILYHLFGSSFSFLFSHYLYLFLLVCLFHFICLFLLPTFRTVFSVPSMCIVVLYNPCVQSFYTIYKYRLLGPSMRVFFFNHPFVPSRTFWVCYQCMQIERNGGVCLRVCMYQLQSQERLHRV